MKVTSLQPFVPSGKDFNKSKNLFMELGFQLAWEDSGYAGLENNGFSFILQQFDNKEFAENFMLSVGIENAQNFYDEVKGKHLEEKYGIRLAAPNSMPYGIEVNLIDIAGVCWHFVQG